MFTFEPMSPADIFSLDLVNLDAHSENFTLDYYLSYLLTFPDIFITVQRDEPVAPASLLLHRRAILGYIFGKFEQKEMLCAHISALSVGPAWRCLGVAAQLCALFEGSGNAISAGFSDLYVREANLPAIRFYNRQGYERYRTVFSYYAQPSENAWDMRKPLRADSERRSLVSGRDIHADEIL